MKSRAIFLDKDGTLVEDVPYNVDPALLRFTPHALPALRRLQQAGYRLVIVSNQSGLATGRFTSAQLSVLRTALLAKLQDEGGIEVTGFYVCPHAPASADGQGCECRKPQPGMLTLAAQAHGLDLQRSWMVGDILDDVEAGHRAGCRSVLLDRGGETEWKRSELRVPEHVCTDLGEAAEVILQADAAAPAGMTARQAA